MKWAPWIGVAIFVVSLGLRLIGIGWGLPNSLHYESYHPDEGINWGASQLIDPAHLDFTPGFYNYGTLFLTASKIASGYCPPLTGDSREDVANYEACCLLAGRILSALAGAGTGWVIFAMLRRRTHLLGASFGGLAAGLAPAFVVHSRFDTVDVAATCLMALSLFFALNLLPDQDGSEPSHYIRYAALAGMFAGLSAGTKYLGIIVILALYAAIVLVRKPGALKLIAIGTVAAIVAFVVSTPGVLLDSDRFRAGLAYEAGHASTGQGLVFVDTSPNSVYHLISLAIGIGTLGMLIGLAALLYAGVKKHPWAIVLLAFALPYFLVISMAEVKFLRYTFPLYVPICAAFGWATGQAHRRATVQGKLIVIIGMCAFAFQLRTDKQYAIWMADQDPRDQAGVYFHDLASKQPGMTVGVTSDPWFYTPALYKDSAMSRPRWQREGEQQMAAATDPKVVRFTPDQRPDYVTYSTLESRDLDRLADAKDLSPDNQGLVDQWKATMARLQAEYKPAARFPQHEIETPGPYREDMEYVHPFVYVWKRKDLP